MASGHVNRTYRPNTWQHRPSLRREDSSCQPGAVHTWHLDICAKPLAKEWLESALHKGQCIVLLDGIDEIPVKETDAIIQSITSFASRYRKNKFVVTCRVAAFNKSLDGFDVCEVDEFSDEDIEKFLKQWFGADSPDGHQLLRDIKSSSLARDLAKTPLLLTLVCILFGYRRTIPDNRAELYEACVDALLFRWDTFRSVERPAILTDTISPEKKSYCCLVWRKKCNQSVSSTSRRMR